MSSDITLNEFVISTSLTRCYSFLLLSLFEKLHLLDSIVLVMCPVCPVGLSGKSIQISVLPRSVGVLVKY